MVKVNIGAKNYVIALLESAKEDQELPPPPNVGVVFGGVMIRKQAIVYTT
jgi:hypothetical protein